MAIANFTAGGHATVGAVAEVLAQQPELARRSPAASRSSAHAPTSGPLGLHVHVDILGAGVQDRLADERPEVAAPAIVEFQAHVTPTWNGAPVADRQTVADSASEANLPSDPPGRGVRLQQPLERTPRSRHRGQSCPTASRRTRHPERQRRSAGRPVILLVSNEKMPRIRD